MSENLRQFTRAVYGLDAVAARVRPDAWDGPSPCAGWTARDVAGHAAWVVQMIGALAAGEAPRSGLTEAEVAGEDPAATIRRSVAATLEQLDHQGSLQRIAATPFGEMPLDDFLGVIWVDPFTHAWDVAAATNVTDALDLVMAEAALAVLTPVADALRDSGRFGPPVAIGADADALSRYLAFSGRDPAVRSSSTV